MADRYSVCQFLFGGGHEYVRWGVTAEEAVMAARHYTDSVAARMGVVERVIITEDGTDDTDFEWLKGEGVVFPTQEDLQELRIQEG